MGFHFLCWSLWLGVSELGSCSWYQVFHNPRAFIELCAVLCFPSEKGPSEKGLLHPLAQALHHCKPCERSWEISGTRLVQLPREGGQHKRPSGKPREVYFCFGGMATQFGTARAREEPADPWDGTEQTDPLRNGCMEKWTYPFCAIKPSRLRQQPHQEHGKCLRSSCCSQRLWIWSAPCQLSGWLFCRSCMDSPAV